MYKLLIIIFLVFISFFYCFYYRNEAFTNEVKSNKNIFINNNQKLDMEIINVNNICIKDNDGIECISKEQLFNTLNLPLFRKHAMCIEDACITSNNLKKISGDNKINLKTTDNKCFELDKIPGTLSIRQQARWETDKKGMRDGDLSASKYHSLYEPKGGWIREAKCGKKYRPPKKDGKRQPRVFTNKKYNYGHTDLGVYSKEQAILKYGCARKHSRWGGICWASAGGKCHRDRNNRRRLSKSFYKNKLYNLEVDVDDTLNNIPSLKQNTDCTQSNTKFKVEVGDVISNFKNIINPMNGISYKPSAKHDIDHNRVIQ